ncbi:oxygenase MpaB family protein, partial [Streptomyces sp. DSM 41524]|nr:oxygenase MpaB family protein [Streptomyces sp. DSM 41524]
EMWPEDRNAFDSYWKQSLQDLRIDPPVREHLYGVATLAFLAFLPAPIRLLAGRFNLFATTGFLPAEFRGRMRMSWTADQQRRFERLLTGLRVADRVIPHEVWLLGYQLYLWDMRIRDRFGKRVV